MSVKGLARKALRRPGQIGERSDALVKADLACISLSKMCRMPVVSLPATRLVDLPLRAPPQFGSSPPLVTSSETFALVSDGFTPSTDCILGEKRRMGWVAGAIRLCLGG